MLSKMLPTDDCFSVSSSTSSLSDFGELCLKDPVSESTQRFESSGSLNEFQDAANIIISSYANTEVDVQELIDFLAPNGFTLLHLLPLASQVEDGDKQALLDNLTDSEVQLLLNKATEKHSVDKLSVECAVGHKMPLANGDTPLHIAIFMGSERVFEMLLDILSDTTYADETTSSEVSIPLEGNYNCPRNNTGNNYFNLAAGQSLGMLEQLCDHFRGQEEFNSFITNQTNSGKTPLHHAAKSQHKERLEVFAKLLVEGAEASIDIVDNDGKKPLEYLSSLQDDFPELKETVIHFLSADDDEGKRQGIIDSLDNAFQTIQNDPEIAVDKPRVIIP
ncbi:ankyrin repeat domain-containing protein [Endozoicomonas ascidiicola]|uniref:ankyrin repeat domain-containing protein n=1 Tax=Endozoicomonas ascidiicola TaxID=1698521 RepID=UPI0008322604|nr:ankyrin repeat domain-containing protein [Endozoicomonas ascidiicola]